MCQYLATRTVLVSRISSFFWAENNLEYCQPHPLTFCCLGVVRLTFHRMKLLPRLFKSDLFFDLVPHFVVDPRQCLICFPLASHPCGDQSGFFPCKGDHFDCCSCRRCFLCVLCRIAAVRAKHTRGCSRAHRLQNRCKHTD